jgi:DNA mismatch endonuclease (patch repair protein)
LTKDRLTKEHRSWNMSRIRSKNTNPERAVRSMLHRMGFRFRLHAKIPLPPSTSDLQPRTGTKRTLRFIRPDILLPKHKTAIFVHGCFWHRHRGCKNCTTPTNRREWWVAKLEGNVSRDKVHERALRKIGWRTLVVWECQAENPKTLQPLLTKFIRRLRPALSHALWTL